ncbi:MAG: hypothetical protein EAX96_08380 [Candidatus Lokiarchaeota archaeon]|nr:hypothetical protein [Candidatus Lokiarchaeota archaeon]
MTRYRRLPKKIGAKDQDFKQAKLIDHYFINIGLVSIRTIRDYDLASWTAEFYFRTGKQPYVSRIPNKGVIQLEKNESFEPRDNDISLFTEFVKLRSGDDMKRTIKVKLFERDLLKKDQKIIDADVEVNLASNKSEYMIIQDKNEYTKVKLRVFAGRTRY